MYEQIRTRMTVSLLSKLDAETVNTVLTVLDRVMADYDVSQKETAMVLYDNSFVEAIKFYLASKKAQGAADGSLTNDYYTLRNFSSNVGKSIKEITTNDIRAYLLSYQMRTKVKNATLNKIRMRLHCFFEWCVGEEIIQRNPMSRIPIIKSEPSQRHAITEEQLEYCRMNCLTKRDRALLEVFYSTGARLAEISRLQKDDIDWQTGSIEVMGKGRSPYTVYLNAKAKVALKAYLNSRKDINPALFVTERGAKRLTPKGIRVAIEAIGERAKLDVVLSPHVLRHTMATTALRHGAPMETVQRMLNHKSPATTQRYAKLDNSRVWAEHQRTVV